MRRRDFVQAIACSAAGWPLAAHAQQPRLPAIGWLASATAEGWADRLNIFRDRLKETGFVEGQNLTIEYRWADDRNDRLPALAADLVSMRVSVIVCGGGTPTALAAKAATTVIPIVFVTQADPVRAGIVDNLNRPSGNITGMGSFTDQLITKRLELLAELVPSATTIGALLNPDNPVSQNRSKDLMAAARAVGRELRIVFASNASQLEKAFSSAVEQRVGALVVQTDAVFLGHRDQIVTLASRSRLPAIYETRDNVIAGGLVSYGPSTTERYRLLADYTAKILKGEKPQNLPIARDTQFDLIINLKTAKALGLTIPGTVLARANEVIE
jgi:putative tryptophan/tyrosine transport system substrate-binding protein